MLTRVAIVLLRNLAGWFVVSLGIFLSLPFVPGPGLALVLLGLTIADWPGKRRLFRALRSMRWFRKFDDWAHHRFGHRLPEHRTERIRRRLAEARDPRP